MPNNERLHRYLLGFYKKGNMRFISHLDLQRLFKRCIKRARIDVAYSNGYNPHEKINIVHPLSLGFETERDYFEMDTLRPYGEDELVESMNLALPEGIRCERHFCDEPVRCMVDEYHTRNALKNIFVNAVDALQL